MSPQGKKEEKKLSPWEADYQLLVCEGLFSEYLEMGESSCCFRSCLTGGAVCSLDSRKNKPTGLDLICRNQRKTSLF